MVLPSAPVQQAKQAPLSASTDQQAPMPAPGPEPEAERNQLGNGHAAFLIRRAPDSHFYADAEVNGATVHFLVDTGASGIVLTQGDAQRAGVSVGDQQIAAITAGGEVQLAQAKADRVALGPMVAKDVPVLVAKNELPISLLGQSYLSRIGSVSIAGDTMTLE